MTVCFLSFFPLSLHGKSDIEHLTYAYMRLGHLLQFGDVCLVLSHLFLLVSGCGKVLIPRL